MTRTREERIAGFTTRHNEYLTRAAQAPKGKPDMLYFHCPRCGFGFFETWELSHHAPDKHGHQETWEPLCPACDPAPAGPPRMVQLTGHRSREYWHRQAA